MCTLHAADATATAHVSDVSDGPAWGAGIAQKAGKAAKADIDDKAIMHAGARARRDAGVISRSLSQWRTGEESGLEHCDTRRFLRPQNWVAQQRWRRGGWIKHLAAEKLVVLFATDNSGAN